MVLELPGPSRGIQSLPVWATSTVMKHLSWERPGGLSRQLIEVPCQGQRAFRWDREELGLRPVVLIPRLPGLVANASADSPDALVVEHLLHPEAPRRAVQQAEEAEVVLLRGLRRQLDDRGGAVEDLATPVQDEVVVGGDEGEGDGEGGASPVLRELVPVVPGPSSAPVGASPESRATPELGAEAPEPDPATIDGKTLPLFEVLVVREENRLVGDGSPIPHTLAPDLGPEGHFDAVTLRKGRRLHKGLVCVSVLIEADRLDDVVQASGRTRVHPVAESCRTTPLQTPRVLDETSTRSVRRAHVLPLAPRLPDELQDLRPNLPPSRVHRRLRLPPDPQHGPYLVRHRRPLPSREDDGRGAVAWDVGPGGVDDVGQVPPGQDVLDEPLAELSLHERVGDDRPDEARRRRIVAHRASRQVEEALQEGADEGVLPVAGVEALPVEPVEPLVAHGDVGRIAHHDVVRVPQDLAQELRVLGEVEVLVRVLEAGERVLGVEQLFRPPPMEQRVPGGHLHPETRRLDQPADVTGVDRGHQEPEPGDRRREGVQVHPRHPVQHVLHQGPHAVSRPVPSRELEQPPEGPQEEVARAAGRVDHGHRPVPEGLDGRGQRQVEDELLHELRRLEQGVALAGGLGEVLVEVAEEAGVQRAVVAARDERMPRLAGLRVRGAEGLEQVPGAVGRRGDRPERVVGLVEQRAHAGEGLDGAEDVEEVLALAVAGVVAEVGALVVPGEAQVGLVGAAEPAQPARAAAVGAAPIQEAAILQEADEDTGQHPGDGGLGDEGLAEVGLGLGGAAGLLGGPVLAGDGLGELRVGLDPLLQVGLQGPHGGLEGFEESFTVHAGATGHRGAPGHGETPGSRSSRWGRRRAAPGRPGGASSRECGPTRWG